MRRFPPQIRALAGSSGWRRDLLVTGLLWLAIMMLFADDVADMVHIWWTSSTYGHCLFIPPLLAWLVALRIDTLRKLTPRPWAGGLAWLGAGALCWLLGDAASLALLRHGGVVVMLQGAVIAVLGPILTRALLFPLFYAFFLIPVGSELEPAMQLLTARIATAMLGWAGVPAHIEGIFITIPTGYFRVAEACSGAKFLIAMTAYAVLVCNVCFRSGMRRALFLIFALTTCIIANGIRAFATIYVAHRTSIDAAAGFDHVVYGWLFFALVMATVMAAAWPFFDRRPGDPVLTPETVRSSATGNAPLSMVVAGALALLAAAPAWAIITARAGQTEAPQLLLPPVPGWSFSDVAMKHPWKPRFANADRFVQGRYADGKGHVVDLAVAAYARQSEGRELIAFGQGSADPETGWSWSSSAPAPASGKGETISAPGPVERQVVSFYRIGDGSLTGDAAAVKFAAMMARLTMGNQRAMAILVSAEDSERSPADAAIAAFLDAAGGPEELADAVASNR